MRLKNLMREKIFGDGGSVFAGLSGSLGIRIGILGGNVRFFRRNFSVARKNPHIRCGNVSRERGAKTFSDERAQGFGNARAHFFRRGGTRAGFAGNARGRRGGFCGNGSFRRCHGRFVEIRVLLCKIIFRERMRRARRSFFLGARGNGICGNARFFRRRGNGRGRGFSRSGNGICERAGTRFLGGGDFGECRRAFLRQIIFFLLRRRERNRRVRKYL